MGFVWILLVDHKFQAISSSGCFQVDTASIDDVDDLKGMVKETRPMPFIHADVYPAMCIVWRTKGELAINNNSTVENVEEILRSINVCDENTIELICEGVEVADLQLSDSEVLLMQMITLPQWNVASNDESDAAQNVHVFGNHTQRALPMFTDTTKRSSNDSDGSQSSQSESDRPEGGSGDMEELEASGYNKVVPDVLETKGGTWERITLGRIKLPPHLRTVYQWKDQKKTEYIAKLIREGSREPDIFYFLRMTASMTGSHSPHVISPIETVTSATRNWLILPKMLSIYDQRFMQFMRGLGGSARSKLAWGLIDGLAYLHKHKIAHRDIKPANLVCDCRNRLQIIDFDVAIKVQDENTETDEYCGTSGWTAPEMGTEDGPAQMYSPIKADRWSCGRVILRHILVDGKGDWVLSAFANLLMAEDPQQRPSLSGENVSLHDIREASTGKHEATRCEEPQD